jgi:Lipopolysaccharide-assembly
MNLEPLRKSFHQHQGCLRKLIWCGAGAPACHKQPGAAVPHSFHRRLLSVSLTLLVVAGLFSLVLAGCGYRPVARGETPAGPAGHTVTTASRPTVAIPLFTNRSTEIGLESLFANTFIETFDHSQALRVINRPQNADLILEGKIDSVAYSSTAYFNINKSLVRRVTIRVEVQLKRRSTGKVIWKDQGLVQEDYTIDQTYQEGEALKDMGVRRGAVTLARKMLDKVLLVI